MAIFDDFITLKEAGSISGYHPDYIGALIRSNKVKGKKIGKNWYVSKKEVQEYFTTKHYVPVAKAVFGKAKVLFVFLVLIVFGIAGLYVFQAFQSSPAQAVIQSNLSDTVGTQTDSQGNIQDNVAQPIPVTGQ